MAGRADAARPANGSVVSMGITDAERSGMAGSWTMVARGAMRAGVVGVVLGLAACAQPVAVASGEAVPVNGIGYVILNAPITGQSRDLLLGDIEKLRLAGAKEIHLGMNSPGGEIDAAQGIVDYMARQHAQNAVVFKAYNIGTVASAATYVYLNAQTRYSSQRGAFLFHAAGMVSNGPVSAERLRDQAAKLDRYEQTVLATLKARTRLTDAAATTYVRRTVILTSDDAKRDGIVDEIGEFTTPAGARTWIVGVRPNGAASPSLPVMAPQPR